jgi:hypothetical protein
MRRRQTPAPARTPDGKPNLQGIWQVLNTAAWDIQDHPARLGVPAGQGIVDGNEIPYLPAALAKKRANFENRATADPETKGYLPGVPRIMYMPFPFQILQTPDQIVMVFEYDRVFATSIRMALRIRAARSTGGWVTPGAAGKATRSWSTSCTSPMRRGSIAQETSTATRCTWSNALRRRGRITSTTK